MRSLKKGTLALLSVAALVAATGCGDLGVTNPNNPDVKRVLATPEDVIALAGGNFVSWFNTMEGMDANGPLTTMADSYTASWNNYYMRIYSSEPRSQWINNPAANERVAMEWFWYGHYATLSAANDVLRVIDGGTLQYPDSGRMMMAKTLATLMQGLTLSELALNYDKALFVDEHTTDLSGLDFSPRAAIRDSALKKLDAAIALAEANDFETDAEWTGGNTYSNSQIAQIANTAAARALAYFPRNAAENGQVEWARVASYAANGLSKPGSEFDFLFTVDGNCPDNNGVLGICDALKLWGEDPTTMRLDTRVAHMLDPVTQHIPWPDPNGNPPPNSPDARLGDGTVSPTIGSADWAEGVNAVPAGPGSRPGTDFIWNNDAIFNPTRGSYHQSNITHIRYVYVSFLDPAGAYVGPVPVMSAGENDLLWAEGLIRSGGSLALAAEKINNTRVTRGQLTPATAAEGVGTIDATPGVVGTGLLGKLQYEQDIELIGLNAVPYYNRRRIDGLQPLTPHEMPVPAKELGVLRQELYTFGGTNPPNSGSSLVAAPASVQNVQQIATRMAHRSRGFSFGRHQ